MVTWLFEPFCICMLVFEFFQLLFFHCVHLIIFSDKVIQNCQNPTLTQLSSKQLGLGLDTIVTWDTYISHGTSSYKPWNMHPKLWIFFNATSRPARRLKGVVSSFQIGLILPSVAETDPKINQSWCNMQFSVCRHAGGKGLSLENHHGLFQDILFASICSTWTHGAPVYLYF